MTMRTDHQPAPAASEAEDDAAFSARAARYGFVRAEQIDPDQTWFWTRKWIEGEIEAEIDIAAGRMTTHLSTEEFLAALDRAAADADARRG